MELLHVTGNHVEMASCELKYLITDFMKCIIFFLEIDWRLSVLPHLFILGY